MKLYHKILPVIKKRRAEILFVLFTLTLALYFSFNYTVLYVSGESMMPTYDDKDIVLIKESKTPEKGDLIIFTLPEEWGSEGYNLIKRVFATEGDKIIYDYPNAIINGEVNDFSAKGCPIDINIEFTLNQGEYLVAGDNIGNSNDSYFRYCMGLDDYIITEDLIQTQGKEVFKIGGFR